MEKVNIICFVLCCIVVHWSFVILQYTDIPCALEDEVHYHFGWNKKEFNLLLTLYAAPNIIIPYIVGILLSQSDPMAILHFLLWVALLGSSIFATAIGVENYTIALLGRFIQGCAGEAIEVCLLAMMAMYFHKTNNFPLGIYVCFQNNFVNCDYLHYACVLFVRVKK